MLAWSTSGRIQRPRPWWAVIDYRSVARRLPRAFGSARRLVAMAKRLSEDEAEAAKALASWRGRLAD